MTPSTSNPLDTVHTKIEELLDGLDDSIIASLAYAKSLQGTPTAGRETPAHGKELASVKTTAFVEEKPAKHSLLKEFYIADKYQKIILPPGPTGSNVPGATTASPMLSSNNMSDPFIQEPVITGDAFKESPLFKSDTTLSPYTSPSQSFIQKSSPSTNDHPSHAVLKQCQKSFTCIEEIFVNLTPLLQQPVSQKKWFFASRKRSRTANIWNLYQAYFARYYEEELE
ncbi:hypothetical protein C0995_009702 [Termitomyces sp. Mi166|nr:hypothetical protein C0995_009702 [Termitomyces sp. Mi166\